MLRDSSGLAGDDIRRANRIKQGGLPVIDVAHHRDYRRAWNFNIVGVGGDQFFELLFGDHLFKWHEANVISEALAQIRSHIIVQSLIDGRKHASLKQQSHDLFRFDPKFFSQFLDRGSFDQAHGL